LTPLRHQPQQLTLSSNAFIFPTVYFFFPETRYRSLEEMDDIFKKSSNIFDVVKISIEEPYRYDKHGQLKEEFLAEAGIRREDLDAGVLEEEKPNDSSSQ
jgi:hypothetical protein